MNFRKTWPETRITPKLHMLEDHIIPFYQVGMLVVVVWVDKMLNQYTTTLI